jgi:predicted transcriptional regulator
MFWRYAFQAQSAVSQLLEQDDCTVERLLDEPEIIQETKSMNNQLINLCVRASVEFTCCEADMTS